MKIISTIAEMQSFTERRRGEGKRIGFVPTMGFLHEGHLSLMRQARSENDIVAASIFVNPAQFGPGEDLDRYPRDAEGDSRKCESAGIDVLFMPSAAEMYPGQPQVFVTVEGLSDILEGAIRPGRHFRGVATVVAKLFNIVKPHRAYFGQKDFQQCAVIKQMTRGLNMDLEVRVLPTMRESDGLAMSSRNSYLSSGERSSAAVLYQALAAARELFETGAKKPDKLKSKVREVVAAEPAITLDYVEIVDADLKTRAEVEAGMAILIAARLGRTRLIDNIVLE